MGRTPYMSAINLPYPHSYNLKELAQQYTASKTYVDATTDETVSAYFPTPNKERLKELAAHVNDHEAQQILSVLLAEATKENGIVLSRSVVDALVLMVTDSCGGPPPKDTA